MIEQVDRAMERFLRLRAQLEEGSVAISLETPEKAWGAARTRPTVSLFLWDITRNPKALRAGTELRTDALGTRQHRPMTPIVDFHYLVTAWASEPRDEHQLLGSVLRAVLAHSRLPDEVLPEALSGKRCGIGLAPYDVRPPGELWTALGGAPRPAIQLEVSLPVEVFEWVERASPPEEIGARVRPREVEPPAAEPTGPGLTRRRSAGMVVMEGRPEPRGEPGAPSSRAPRSPGATGRP